MHKLLADTASSEFLFCLDFWEDEPLFRELIAPVVAVVEGDLTQQLQVRGRRDEGVELQTGRGVEGGRTLARTAGLWGPVTATRWRRAHRLSWPVHRLPAAPRRHRTSGTWWACC